MKRLYSLNVEPRIISHNQLAVFPGQPYDFTDEQIKAGISGLWSEENPRAGLAQERAFKARRDAEAHTDPAEPEKE